MDNQINDLDNDINEIKNDTAILKIEFQNRKEEIQLITNKLNKYILYLKIFDELDENNYIFV